jgi:hypothetical protein
MSPRSRIALAGAAVAAIAAGATAFLLHRRRSRGPLDHLERWSCECGQPYRVSGSGRHRVYWLEGAAESDPVISGTCPSCDRALPSTSDTTITAVV